MDKDIVVNYIWTGVCLMLCLVLLSGVARAHPADLPCASGDNSVDGCQPTYTYGNLQDPTFFELHRVYWHHRRELNQTIVRYAVCVGKVQERELVRYGRTFSKGSSDILKYWTVIPAHPVIDEGKDYFAQDSIDAAIATNSIFNYHVYLCESYLGSLR